MTRRIVTLNLVLHLLLVSCPLPAQRAGGAAASPPAGPIYRIWLAGTAAGTETIYLRQPFTLKSLPTSARLRILAAGASTVFINGASVHEDTGGSRWREVWITRYLMAGRNLLAMACHALPSGNGVAFELMLRYSDGRTAYVISNGDERMASRYASGWQQPAFDDHRWAKSRVMRQESRVESRETKDRGSERASGRAGEPTLNAPRSTPNAQPPTPSARYDYSRLVRVWDIESGGRPGGNPYARPRAAGERMLLTTSVPAPTDLAAVASAGFTLYQTDSDHLGTEETAPGVWDYRGPDAVAGWVRRQGFDWCYFPHFAFPPKWYRDQVPFTRIRCLEHDRTAEAFSPWEPKFGAYAARGYDSLGQHYNARANAQLSALYLGVHGDYGECGLLMGARVAVPGQKEDWQRRFGNLHDHLGWWCADPLARADFRRRMMQKYHDLDVLNAAWKTSFRRDDEIKYPAAPTTGSRRYWLDFVEWYTDSASSLTDTISRLARRNFPDSLLMLPVGFGDENPRGGNDNSLLPKIAARNRVDVRSTHGGYQPFAQNQAMMLGRIASACRFYGAPFWTEPPSRITAEGQVARIFAAASLGSKGYFDWADNVRDTRDVYYRFSKFLKVEKPVVDVAMLYPTTSHLLRPDIGYPQTFMQGCTAIRDVLNYDIVDERMIRDGALNGCRLLVLWEGTVIEKETLDRIRDWVQAGGVLVGYDFGKIETVEGDRSWFSDLFGYAGKLAPATAGLRYLARGGVPAHYRISVGQPAAVSYLSGDWYEPETLGGVARRWTGASADVRLPVNPAVAWTLRVRASFPPETARQRREVLVNGVKVGELNTTTETTYEFPLPDSLLAGKEAVTVTLHSETWVPATTLKGSADRRVLGTWVTYVQMDESGSLPAADPGLPGGRFETVVDQRRLRTEWTRPYGRGLTVYFPATRRQLAGYYEVIRYLTYHLSELDKTRRDAIPVDDAWDGVYATLLSDKILYYNPGATAVIQTLHLTPEAFAGRRDVETPATFTAAVTVDPVSISAFYFGESPQELLLQCEKFTEPGSLKPREGAEFSPGRGKTHLLLPAGQQIATRFQCDAPGRYRLFYRATQSGKLTRADLLLDGKRVEGGSVAAPPREAAVAATRLAGTVRLTKGIHSLVLRAPRGQALRADFVILATDPTIAGYGFGVQAASRSSR